MLCYPSIPRYIYLMPSNQIKFIARYLFACSSAPCIPQTRKPINTAKAQNQWKEKMRRYVAEFTVEPLEVQCSRMVCVVSCRVVLCVYCDGDVDWSKTVSDFTPSTILVRVIAGFFGFTAVAAAVDYERCAGGCCDGHFWYLVLVLVVVVICGEGCEMRMRGM